MPSAASPGLVDRSARVRFRRAVTLMLMTLLLPGSAQLVAGHKRVGRLALRVWLGLLCAFVLGVVLGLLAPGALLWIGSNTMFLGVLRFALLVLALGWAALFVDAWRLGQPLELRQRQRLAMVGINGVLCFGVAGTLLFASHVVGVQRDFITTMFGNGAASAATQGRYNVLLLGGDSGIGRWGLRPDSLTVASIDAETGRTILFGLPRNMQNFPFRPGSVMAEQFPRGFDCEGCYLNSLATYAADHRQLFAGSESPGVDATIAGVEGITGLDVHYFAMVDLRGFRKLVDALGGLELNVLDRIPIGGVGGPVTGYIEPGRQHLNGFQTLWFARSREGADDYSRMARQKCVMHAMLQQLSPRTVVTKLSRIAEASTDVLTTDIPASELHRFIPLALKAKAQPLRTVSFVPPAINTADPDIEQIQRRVQHAIDRSEAGPRASEAPAPEERGAGGTGGGTGEGAGSIPQAPTTGGSVGSLAEGYAANDTSDLSSAC